MHVFVSVCLYVCVCVCVSGCIVSNQFKNMSTLFTKIKLFQGNCIKTNFKASFKGKSGTCTKNLFLEKP